MLVEVLGKNASPSLSIIGTPGSESLNRIKKAFGPECSGLKLWTRKIGKSSRRGSDREIRISAGQSECSSALNYADISVGRYIRKSIYCVTWRGPVNF